MKSYLYISIILLFSVELRAQITNSYEANNTGIYYYALDSMIRIIKEEKQLEQVILSTQNLFNHKEFPDTIASIPLIMTSRYNPFRLKHMNSNDIYISRMELQLSYGIVAISLILEHKPDDFLVQYEGGSFNFQFTYDPKTKSYIPSGYFEGSMMIHHIGKVKKLY